MENLFRTYIGIVDKIIDSTGKFISWLTLILVLLICYDVVMRYLFNYSTVAIYELEWHLFAMIFLIGGAYALKHDRHVRVDVFYHNLSEKNKHWVNLVGTLLFLLPFCYIAFTASLKFVAFSLQFNESSADPGGLPARYLIKGAIPAGVFLLSLQALSLLFQSILGINKQQAHVD